MNKLILCGIAITFGLATHSHAVSFTFVGAGAMSGGVFTPSTGFTAGTRSYQLGGGLLIGYRMFKALTTELGVLYLPRGFSQTPTDGVAHEFSFTTVQVPLILRIHLLPSFSIGLGGYFSHGLGFVSGSLASDPATVSLQDYGVSYGADDYGVVASVALKFGIVPFTSIVIDGRFLSGVANVCKINGITATLTDYQVLVGVRFGK